MKHIFTQRRTGFTLIEILVVIAIIAVLAGILLAALSGIQETAKKTQTSSLLQSFARACDEFALDHGRYPGLLPDSVLPHSTVTDDNGTEYYITPMQNAMLELMGGARVKNQDSTLSVQSEYDNFGGDDVIEIATIDDNNPNTGLTWSLKFDKGKFGDGPWIKGRVFEPYFSPKSSDISFAPTSVDASNSLPTLIDAWETPIIYMRAVRKNGPVIADPANADDIMNYKLPQFELPALEGYVEESALNDNGSLLSMTKQSDQEHLAWLTLLLSHPTFWEIDPTNASTEFTNGTAWSTCRGRYVLISAGADTTFLEVGNEQMHVEQEIDTGDPYSSLEEPDSGNIEPTKMESFDDVVVHGGA